MLHPLETLPAAEMAEIREFSTLFVSLKPQCNFDAAWLVEECMDIQMA